MLLLLELDVDAVETQILPATKSPASASRASVPREGSNDTDHRANGSKTTSDKLKQTMTEQRL